MTYHETTGIQQGLCESGTLVIKKLKDDQTEENTFEILQHSDRNRNNS